LPIISPAEISKASAGSSEMMSSKAIATTSVSLGVAASRGGVPASRAAVTKAARAARRVQWDIGRV
jgi:hypothetical protein